MIKAAAIKATDGTIHSVPRPGKHHNVIAEMVAIGISPKKGVQGFLTDQDVFVDRKEACVIAKAHGQIIKKHGSADTLYSEDMW